MGNTLTSEWLKIKIKQAMLVLRWWCGPVRLICVRWISYLFGLDQRPLDTGVQPSSDHRVADVQIVGGIGACLGGTEGERRTPPARGSFFSGRYRLVFFSHRYGYLLPAKRVGGRAPSLETPIRCGFGAIRNQEMSYLEQPLWE